VRILCSETESREILYNEVDAFTLQPKKKPYIKLPIKSVGVQGDFRTYKHPGILNTTEKNIEKLEELATKLINHYSEINRCIVPLGQNFAGKIREISLHKTDTNASRVKILQRADAIVTKLLREAGEYETVWQFPVVLMPVSFNNTGEESVVLRPVDSIDAMSASVGKLPFELLEKMATEILKSREISAVFLDCTSKPPGTIEWE
jgi:GMP synthase (glutamine-hydrolysing)